MSMIANAHGSIATAPAESPLVYTIHITNRTMLALALHTVLLIVDPVSGIYSLQVSATRQ